MRDCLSRKKGEKREEDVKWNKVKEERRVNTHNLSGLFSSHDDKWKEGLD